MSKVVDFRNIRVTRDERIHRPGECAHRHIKLDRHGGVVTCATCNATLSSFWALEMLSEQYRLAMANIDRLTTQLKDVSQHVITLSAELDERRLESQERRHKE